MSWEEYKKKRENKSSWEQYKQQRQKDSAQISNNKSNNAPILQNIKDFIGNTGRTASNLLLGGRSGVKQSLNFAYKAGETRNKTEQQIKNERVLGSKELNDTEKALYIAKQKGKAFEQNNLNDKTNKNVILPLLNNNSQDYNNAKVEEIANNNVLDRLINKDQSKIQENIENQTNNFSKKLAELAPSIGNMGVGTAISAVNPVAGIAYFTTSAGGSYMQDALDRGMTREQAINYGAIMGLMEGVTEAIGIENFKKAGKGIKTLISSAGKTAVKEGAEQIAKNSIKTVLKDYGIGIADNIMQEAIIEPIQEITAGAVAGQDKANWNDMAQRMLKAGIDGGLTSAIVGGANLGIQSCLGISEKIKNNQNVTQQELQTAVKDASKQLDVEKMIIDGTQEQVNKYKALTEQQQSTQNQQNTTTQQIAPIIQNNAQNGILEQNVENNSGSFNAPINTKNISDSQVEQDKNVKAPISEETKARKHYKSIMESPYTSKEAKTIAKELMGTDTYVPDSNESQLQRANERIQNSTPESELNSFMSKVMNGEKITATDIAVGEKLIQYYSKTGDKGKLQDAIQATAMAGTSAGQTVQALSILNHQTPEGQAIWLQRSVEKMNNDLKNTRGVNAEQFNLTEDMINKIVNSQNKEELQNNLNDVYKELGQQVSKTNLQKIDAWRYFSMLANPKTHIRNIVGNTAMAGVQSVKNKVAGAIEGVVSKLNPKIERNHTIISASKEVTIFAKNDIKNVADRLGLNENKYNPKIRLENSMRTFKSDVLENTIGKLFDLNDNLLEAEDGWGLKAGYTKALAEYITANNLNPDTITDKQLAKARNYAVVQAQEATFHQASAIATALNQFQNKNGLIKFAMDSILPFKKTPINVAKAGLEYSPAGLAKSLIYDTVNLRKGNITVNKYIDNISKGLTGTGIALLGYALADAGILKASGSDDKDKEKYDEEIGKQTYSINIAGNTYSLDWLAPTGIPLFIGAECHEIMKTDKEEKTTSSDENSVYNRAIKSATNILDSFTNAMNPMTEMSMLSGLTSALKSYDQGKSQMLASLGTNAVKSYVNQFVPTAVGQLARTSDEYERNTTSTKTGVLPKAIDTTKNQIMNKIPGLRQILPIKTDIWGNQVKQSNSITQRGLENSVFPWTRKEVSTSKVDNELTRLYDEIGERSILPDTLSKKLTINGQDYRLTNEEYAKYKASYGKTSYKLLNDLISSSEYKNMSTQEKQIAIESIYNYAKEKNKVDYSNTVKETIETSTNYKILEELNKSGGNQTQYLNYISKTKEIQGEKANQKKNQVLFNSNYSSKTKAIIYKNTTGKEDNLYNILSNGKIDIDEYLDYKIRDSKDEFASDKDSDGKAISGSAKNKIYDYVNKSITGTGNKLLILGSKYKLTDNERKKLTEYINNTIPSKNEKIEIFKKLDKNYTVKEGKVYYK